MKFARKTALGWAIVFTLIAASSAHAAPGSNYGKLSGIVVDPSGTPQMGATVIVLAENAAGNVVAQLLTNQHGAFSGERLLPGLYSVRVTLAGFLPSIERHVRVSSNLTTLLKIELDSVFTSFDRLRRRPEQQNEADDWKWVLRTSAATRPVLQWLDGEVLEPGEVTTAEGARQRRPRGRVELTSGASHPGAVSSRANAPATSFAYDQKLGRPGRLLLAGQMSYEGSAAAGLATMWLPSGEFGRGPETSLILREARLGPNGPTFRALRLDHADQLALGDRLTLKFGGEYILVGLGSATSSLRPRGEVDVRFSPNWRASLLIASRPMPENDADLRANSLQAALAELGALPTVLWRSGRPVLAGGWHEEIAVERRLGYRSSVQAAAFHDSARHLAVFGRGTAPNPDFFQDAYSDGFSYDGGSANSWGTRLAFRQKISDDLEFTAVYAWAGTLALDDLVAGVDLRDALQMRYRHSLAARFTGRVPRVGTRVTAGYKWVKGSVVSRQDVFGEAAYKLDPFLNLSIRQSLPGSLMGGRWEALADFRNLLAQGYVPVNGRDGGIVLLPAFRTIRGGVSFQF